MNDIQARTRITSTDHAANGFVLWIMAYAIIMVSLFALQHQGGGFVPAILPGDFVPR